MSKLFCENDDLIIKLNESNKLVKKYKKLTENSLEKLKELECLNVDLDAKLVLSNKLVDELKCENESLKMHAKCLIAKPIAKKDDNICCNHVVVPDFMPNVCVRLNLINYLIGFIPCQICFNLAISNPVFRWESCKGSV